MRIVFKILPWLLLILAGTARASDNLVLFDGAIRNGWQLWLDVTPGPSYNGSASFTVTPSFRGGGFDFHHAVFSTTPYASLTFAVNGGTAGGHVLKIRGMRSDGTSPLTYTLPALVANTWQTYDIPLSSLGLADIGDLHHLAISDSSAGYPPDGSTFYMAQWQLKAKTAPTQVTVTVDAGKTLGTLAPQAAGLNVAVWDGTLGDARLTGGTLDAIGAGALRFPGGSTADLYHWAENGIDGDSGQLGSSGKAFAALAEAHGNAPVITVNYGSGTPEEAAAWVAWANGAVGSTQHLGTDAKGRDWETVGYWAALRAAAPLATDDGLNVLRAGHPAPYAWKRYEIGNENYGGWEVDRHGVAGSSLNGLPHDPGTYGGYAARFITQMKAVDASIRVGVVASYGAVLTGRSVDDFCDAGCDPSRSVPARSGGSHYGWNAVMLYTLAQAGVRPDFLTGHFYPIAAGLENDALVLGSPALMPIWSARLRRQLADYGFADVAQTLELTQGEANLGSNRRQSVSLVDGLFYADNLGQTLTAGFASSQWWALRNGEVWTGDDDSGVYGHRNFGCEGVVSNGNPDLPGVPPSGTLYPAGQVFRQLAGFRTAGAQLVQASSSDTALAVYATRQASGALTLLVVNKSPTQAIQARFDFKNFIARPGTANISTYGKNEDARDAGPTTSNALWLGTLLGTSFQPYSVTVVTVPSLL